MQYVLYLLLSKIRYLYCYGRQAVYFIQAGLAPENNLELLLYRIRKLSQTYEISSDSQKLKTVFSKICPHNPI